MTTTLKTSELQTGDDSSYSLPELTRERHVAFLVQTLTGILPGTYASLDTNRLTLVHFCIQSLDILGALDECSDRNLIDKDAIIEWIYSLQCNHPIVDEDGSTIEICGFQGGPFLGSEENNALHICQHVHIAMTYTALCTLSTLGDDLTRINVPGIIMALKHLQQSKDGSFTATSNGVGAEYDLRFVYCACCISYILGDWTGIEVTKCVEYIQSCQSYDGSFGLVPMQEGHGGSTFCAVASLVLMNKLDVVLDSGWRCRLIKWCVSRQQASAAPGHPTGGMQGRPNKLQDTCYSYWIGGTLSLLGQQDLLDTCALSNYVLTCQTQYGGFSKVFGNAPDLLHSFYSLAWLSLSDYNKLSPLHCALGMCASKTHMFIRNFS